MSDNPYESPQAPGDGSARTVDRSPLILRCVVVSQLVWIAMVGAMARGFLPEAFGVLVFALPIMMLGAPALALYLASGFGVLRFMLAALVELSLFALQFLALLPAVQ